MDLVAQVNVSPGDVAYAHLTVPALLRAHAGSATRRMIVADYIPRPWMDRVAFGERAEQMRTLTDAWQADGLASEVYELHPGDPAIRRLGRRYTSLVQEPHDARGAPITSYLLPLEHLAGGYWVHYDADMLLYQADGYDWAVEGVRSLQADLRALAVSPRVAPPFERPADFPDQPSLVRGGARIERRQDHWRTYFFSARCFLVDVERFRGLAPFIRLRDWPETIARRLTGRTYPPLWEIMVHNAYTKPGRRYRVDLVTEQAFLLHPDNKGEAFQRLLPGILAALSEGRIPKAQRGLEDLTLDAWEAFLGMRSETGADEAKPG